MFKRNPYLVIVTIWVIFPFLIARNLVQAETILHIDSFPIYGQVKNLEPQVLDFRYKPERWQVCVGLPDDPHKTIVGSDGGLYYDYGGGRFYDFKTRLLASLETNTNAGSAFRQKLLHARIPIVISEQDYDGLQLIQRAWAGAPGTNDIAEWNKERVDYLWLTMKNNSQTMRNGRIVINIGSQKEWIAVSNKTQVQLATEPQEVFCSTSPAFVTVWPEPEGRDSTDRIPIRAVRLPSVSRNWGKPNISCDPRFRDILVGYGQPLQFRCHAQPGKSYRLAFGLIESWHDQPDRRPLMIRIEDKTVRKVDLISEYGQHTPVVLLVDATDINNDGWIEAGIYSPEGVEDRNTILTALWLFPMEKAPTAKQILTGGIDEQALAIYDANRPVEQPLKLFFAEQTLTPGQEYNVLISLPQGTNAPVKAEVSQAQSLFDTAVTYWKKVKIPYDRMVVPDPSVQALLDSCIRNIYQARELRNGQPAFQVGPTCYRGTWAADGPFILEAVTYLGRADETRAGLELQVQKDEGPGGVAFSKKCGLRLWMIWRHAQLTGDWNWLKTIWPQVEANVNLIMEYRHLTRDDPKQANYGLMPIGFGDGGLGGQHREYTNVYWTLAGLKAAIQMAEKLGVSSSATWKSEYEDYWETFDKARNRDKLIDTYGNVYVPVTMTGEQKQLPQGGAWAFLQSIYPGRIFTPDDSLMLGTMAMLDAVECEGLIYGTGWLPDGIWNYAGSFYAHAHLWLGHSEKAAATLYAFANHACPLLCWREEQNPKGKAPKYVGDMPHNWAGAEFIRLVRHLLILERGDELHLLGVMPDSWAIPGSQIKMKQIPTSFGIVSLEVQFLKDGHSAIIRLVPPHREKPKKIVIHLEHFHKSIESVFLDGQPVKAEFPINTQKPLILRIQFKKMPDL
ncbi:MAG: hypothetical protein JXA82_19410 [Sedimentisphaerales bacterium]|nr:hypothetical protein [Sedimentisphaerales bacterium]